MAQAGSLLSLFGQLLLTLAFAAALYARGEVAAGWALKFARRLAGQQGDRAVRLSGQADGDIPIEVIGPRPGEKLREELFNDNEQPVPTDAERIMKADRAPLDLVWVEGVIERVEQLVEQGDETFLAQHMAELASTASAGAGDGLSALAK